MGIITSFLWGNTGRTDDPDPVTGLTSRDTYLIKSTWAVLAKDSTGTGVKIFMNLFENHPEYQNLFPFKDVPRKELPNNKRFLAHCNTVVYSFSSIVDNISNSEILVELLKKIGASHKPRGVKVDAYGHLKKVLMDIFKPTMSDDAIKTWDKTLDIAFSVIIKEAKE